SGNPRQFLQLESEFLQYLHRFLETFESRLTWPSPMETQFFRPHPPIFRRFVDEGILPNWSDHNYEFQIPLASPTSNYGLRVSSASVEKPVQFQVLPTDDLKGPKGLDGLFHKMGHPYLKNHPHFLRSHFLRTERTYAVCAEEAVHGFSMSHLLERRGTLYSNECLDLLERIHEALRQLEDVSAYEDILSPWNVLFHFSDAELTEPIAQTTLTKDRVRNWPAFDLKLRLGATMTEFVRPTRSEWTEVISRLERRYPMLARPTSRLDLGFLGLAIYLLEFRTYRCQLSYGDESEFPVSCSQMDLVLQECLEGEGPDRKRREHFLQLFGERLDLLSYPFEESELHRQAIHRRPGTPRPPQTLAASMDPVGPAALGPSVPQKPSLSQTARAAFGAALGLRKATKLSNSSQHQRSRPLPEAYESDQLPS
ncbi:MAG: hypothetical protein AAF191_12895, partial [Verrucomicrobiota bacterium]